MTLSLIILLAMAPVVPEPTGSVQFPQGTEAEVIGSHVELVFCADNQVLGKKQGDSLRFLPGSGHSTNFLNDHVEQFDVVFMSLLLDPEYVATRDFEGSLTLVTGNSFDDARQKISLQTEPDPTIKTPRKPPTASLPVRLFPVQEDGRVLIITRLDFEHALLYDQATGDELAEITFIKEE